LSFDIQSDKNLLIIDISMGESKRRQSALGDKYGQEENILPWLPITKSQAAQAYKLTTRGAWIGIGVLAGAWVVIRFVGPAFGWWNVQ
jgi:hypothetical protein